VFTHDLRAHRHERARWHGAGGQVDRAKVKARAKFGEGPVSERDGALNHGTRGSLGALKTVMAGTRVQPGKNATAARAGWRAMQAIAETAAIQ
jgi:hypothetical protein